MSSKVWDITPAKTPLDRAYARFLFEATGLKHCFSTRIAVQYMPDLYDLFVGTRCGRYPHCTQTIVDRQYAPYGVCSERCDTLADMEFENSRDE